jgi:hypothetical protein
MYEWLVRLNDGFKRKFITDGNWTTLLAAAG